MRIGELAARTGASARSLRYYEDQELLAAERSRSGQRHFPDSAVDRVRLIRQLFAAGLPSRSIAELLPCVADGRATPELIERLAAERDRIDRQIGDLQGTRDRLDAVITNATVNWRTGERCEMPMRNGATSVAKVERDDLGVCYWRLSVADGDRLALITGGTASSIGLAKSFAWTAMRVALGVELQKDG